MYKMLNTSYQFNLFIYLFFCLTTYTGCWNLFRLHTAEDQIHRSTGRHLIAGLYLEAFGDSVPCSNIPQQCPESVLAPLLQPAHLPTVVRNQEPSTSEPSPLNNNLPLTILLQLFDFFFY